MSDEAAARAMLARVRAEIGAPPSPLWNPGVARMPSDALPSRLATGALAWSAIAAATAAAGSSPSDLDPARVALALRSDRVLTVDGVPPSVWSPFSGFWRTADGWIRTHGNYPHHAARLRAGLGLVDDAGPEQVRAALEARTAERAVRDIELARGMAVAVLPENPGTDEALRATPLVDVRRIEGAPGSGRRRSAGTDGRPLAGIRVLDLTRVVAGPVCTRTLALLGADVLRIDPPGLPEPEWQHLDTGHGKRSALLDAGSAAFSALREEADVIVLGYRPGALARRGLSPDALCRRHPGLIVAALSAWGADSPDRAGFDSLVQAESGIAVIESTDGDAPGALPAQALDHSAGYLLAAAITVAVRRRSTEGGSWHVSTSLRRVSAELLGMPRRDRPAVAVDPEPTSHTARFDVGGRTAVTARPALPGREFAAPRPWGRDQPRW